MNDHRILTCYCCRDTYLRGHFKCCAPPKNMASHRWLEQYCETCRKCPRHCACEKPAPEVEPAKPLATTVQEFIARYLEKAPQTKEQDKKWEEKWQPYRD